MRQHPSSDCPEDSAFVLCSQCEDFHTFNSASENPRPTLTRRLYLIVGHRTIGLSLSTGRGATAAAFITRAFRRRDLRPGYGMTLPSCSERCNWMGRLEIEGAQGVPGRSGFGHDAANPYGNLMPSVCQPGSEGRSG